MPIEKTLADPLSAQEIKEIALQEFRKRLDANSLLADGLTYSGFRLEMQANFSLAGRATLVWSDRTEGEKPTADAKQTAVATEYASESPNKAREDHDLPIPVLVTTPAGQERRKVKFAK